MPPHPTFAVCRRLIAQRDWRSWLIATGLLKSWSTNIRFLEVMRRTSHGSLTRNDIRCNFIVIGVTHLTLVRWLRVNRCLANDDARMTSTASRRYTYKIRLEIVAKEIEDRDSVIYLVALGLQFGTYTTDTSCLVAVSAINTSTDATWARIPLLVARIVGGARVYHIHHDLHSVEPAIFAGPPALRAELRILPTVSVCPALAHHVHHALRSMLPTELAGPAVLKADLRVLAAIIVCTALAYHFNHALRSLLLAILAGPASLGVEPRILATALACAALAHTSTIPSGVCRLQYSPVLLPSLLKIDLLCYSPVEHNSS